MVDTFVAYECIYHYQLLEKKFFFLEIVCSSVIA